jgi:pimeloyl-ACP methyl ester carboxylesterase
VTVALLLHGAGSSPQVVAELLAEAVPRGARSVAPDLRGTTESAVRVLDALAADAVPGHGDRRIGLVAGISLGAHAAALWAARSGRDVPLGLVMPAWTGPPDDAAHATASSAALLRARGRARVLADLRVDQGTADDWVVDALHRGWAAYDDDGALAGALDAAASSPGPTLDDLARITGPTAVVALADDPMHPESVARDWAAALPRGELVVVARDAVSSDPDALGRAVRQGLGAATS